MHATIFCSYPILLSSLNSCSSRLTESMMNKKASPATVGLQSFNWRTPVLGNPFESYIDYRMIEYAKIKGF